MIGIAVSKYDVKKEAVGLLAYPICFNYTPSTAICKQESTHYRLAIQPLPFKVTIYFKNITSPKPISGIFNADNYHFSFIEPSANFGRTSASVGEPSASLGEPSASVGEPSASVGEPSASVGEPSASVGGTSARVGGTAAKVGRTVARVGGIALRVENGCVMLENNAIKIEKRCFMECGTNESTPIIDRIN